MKFTLFWEARFNRSFFTQVLVHFIKTTHYTLHLSYLTYLTYLTFLIFARIIKFTTRFFLTEPTFGKHSV